MSANTGTIRRICPRYYNKTLYFQASVVLVFHNEGKSVLLRTVHSVINRTPSRFLEEVLLVDDFSDHEDLKLELEMYIKRFRGTVRLIRNKKREGLIRSRNTGAREAKGVVVVFLDAHCEVNKNWLPPLLAPIYRNHSTMSVPIIDGIDYKDFHYKVVYQRGGHFRGIFEWGMLYKESEVPVSVIKTRKHNSEPYPSPTHAGGLFAIDRQYFLSLELYDEGLLVWGGENFELSFKIWQCGGSVVWVPCSRVGHVYRGFMPYDFGDLVKDNSAPLVLTNYKRVIEVWMDEKYKEYFYTREPLARFIDVGDVSKQLALKTRLQCKSFDWFLKNVATEVTQEYPELPPNKHWGKLVNEDSHYCMDHRGSPAPSFLQVDVCFGDGQIFRLNTEGQLTVGERCVDLSGKRLQQIFCPSGSAAGPWVYKNKTKQLKHSRSGQCVSFGSKNNMLSMRPCSSSEKGQQWSFQPVTPSWVAKKA